MSNKLQRVRTVAMHTAVVSFITGAILALISLLLDYHIWGNLSKKGRLASAYEWLYAAFELTGAFAAIAITIGIGATIVIAICLLHQRFNKPVAIVIDVALLSFVIAVISATGSFYEVGYALGTIGSWLPTTLAEYRFQKALSVPFGTLSLALVMTAISLTMVPKIVDVIVLKFFVRKEVLIPTQEN